jgi:hypothetical protein
MLSNTKRRGLFICLASAAGSENERYVTAKKRGRARLHNVTNQLNRMRVKPGQADERQQLMTWIHFSDCYTLKMESVGIPKGL